MHKWKQPAIRRLLWLTGFIGLVSFAVMGRVVFDGERELRHVDEALRRGDLVTATVHARAAAGWYVPGASHVGEAYARLRHIALTAEAFGHRESALFAWRAIQEASLTTSWLLPSNVDSTRVAESAILRLTAPRSTTP